MEGKFMKIALTGHF